MFRITIVNQDKITKNYKQKFVNKNIWVFIVVAATTTTTATNNKMWLNEAKNNFT